MVQTDEIVQVVETVEIAKALGVRSKYPEFIIETIKIYII